MANAKNYTPMELYHATLNMSECSLKVGDTWLEKSILGFRTLSVKGREPLDVNITETEIGNANGAKYRKKKDKTRTITVSFAIIASNLSTYHRKVNELKSALYGEEQKFIFRDDPDAFFKGTVESISADPAIYSDGYVASGTISIHCSDPYKYSVELKEVEATLDDGNTFGIDYQGTYPAQPIVEVTMNGDNGYVGLLDQNGHILEFGNIEEVDGQTKQKSEYLGNIGDLFNCADDVGGYDAMHPIYGTSGSLKLEEWQRPDWSGKRTYLRLDQAGTKKGNANGGLRTFTFPADSNGKYGAKNWYSYFHVCMWANKLGQTGEMSISFLTSDNKLIAGCNWNKTDSTGNTGNYDMIVYDSSKTSKDNPCGKILKRFNFTTSHVQSQNPWYGNWGHCDLRKEGKKVTFYYNGKYYPFEVPEIENLECTKVQVAIKQWLNRSGEQFMYYLGFDKFSYQKLNVDYWVDSPNLFSTNDVLEINTDTNSVTLNGLSKNSLGKIANNWDEFKMEPGYNQIKVTYSTWAKQPKLKLKYREVYL